MNFTVDFDPEAIRDTLSTWGVVVIRDVYTEEQCREFAVGFTKRHKDALANLPTAKPGQYKDLVCHDRALWDFRREKRWIDLWGYLYKELNGLERAPEMYCSIDGVNIKSDHEKPHYVSGSKDWPHLDQTSGEVFDCIQGQLVFSDSNAGFICSPGSHVIFKELLSKLHIAKNDKSNWLPLYKLRKDQILEVQRLLKENGLGWQQPIKCPRGGAILWLSSTIHSAMAAPKPERSIRPSAISELRNWRVVVYLSFVPKKHLNTAQKLARTEAIRNNKSMNHWCMNVWQGFIPTYNQRWRQYLEKPNSYPQFDANFIEEIIDEEAEFNFEW